MNRQKGSIYIRDNTWYKMANVVKMGISSFAKDRSGGYITGEVERGEYLLVIEIPLEQMRCIDNLLKYNFQSYHIYRGGGTEFYDRCVINLIEPYLQSLNIEYNVLTTSEIETMERCERIRNIKNIKNVKGLINKVNSNIFIQKLKNRRIHKQREYNKVLEIEIGEESTSCMKYIQPNSQQQYVLSIVEKFYEFYNIGKLNWACGLGKALLSILIVQLLDYKNVVFGVPSNNLQKQIKTEILKIFPNKSNILFVGGEEEDEIKTTTDTLYIKSFLNTPTRDCKFVITTYHSCYLIVDKEIDVDFKIGDEAHHLVGIEKEEEKGFRLFHKIKSTKSLFMTATEKMIESVNNRVKYSMDDETIFGKMIDTKTVRWAIENKKITDYSVVTIKTNENVIDEIINKLGVNVSNKELFVSAYMSLKSFEKYNDLSHLLLYTNTTQDAELSKKYIDEILKLNILSIQEKDIYNNALHSKNCNDITSEVNKFKSAIYGIISCVYIFGEGFDLPRLNGVCVSGNMQSETRIVQYLLRANRLDSHNPLKKSYIIIPYIDTDDWEAEEKSFDKVRNIISQMRNVDEMIEQKIHILTISDKKKRKSEDSINNKTTQYEEYDFEETSEELVNIRLRLRYSKALTSKHTEEEDEYNYIRSINRSMNIQSKKEYYLSRHNHNNFIISPEEHFKSKGVWTNWYDFMGVDTTKFIQSKQDWIKFCKEKNITSLDIYYMCCEKYDVLPKDPVDFYKDFTNIQAELSFNITRRR